MPHATVNKVVVMILIINDLLLGRSRGLHEDLLNIPYFIFNSHFSYSSVYI